MLITFLKKLQKIKYKLEHDDKKFETCKIKYKYCNGFLEYKNFKDNLIEYKCLFCNKYCRRKFEEGLKERFLMHANFLITTVISLFHYYKKLFNLMNIWVIGTNVMKKHKKKIFTVT